MIVRLVILRMFKGVVDFFDKRPDYVLVLCSPLSVIFVGIKLPEFENTIYSFALNFQCRNCADIVCSNGNITH